jgi:hypothetical protein
MTDGYYFSSWPMKASQVEYLWQKVVKVLMIRTNICTQNRYFFPIRLKRCFWPKSIENEQAEEAWNNKLQQTIAFCRILLKG